jgi:hypothetical protein
MSEETKTPPARQGVADEKAKYGDLSEADIQAARDRSLADKLLAEKREKGRLATKKSRANSDIAKAKALAEEPLSEMWTRNSRKFCESSPENKALFIAMRQKHDDVAGTVAEVQEILEGLAKGLRCETRCLETRDSTEIMPMVDDCFRDIRQQVGTEGMLNYAALEGATHLRSADGEIGESSFRPTAKEKFDATSPVDCYRWFGFRLRLTDDTYRDALDAFLKYSLVTGDVNIDWALVKVAIEDFKNGKGWHANEREIRALLKTRESVLSC